MISVNWWFPKLASQLGYKEVHVCMCSCMHVCVYVQVHVCESTFTRMQRLEDKLGVYVLHAFHFIFEIATHQMVQSCRPASGREAPVSIHPSRRWQLYMVAFRFFLIKVLMLKLRISCSTANTLHTKQSLQSNKRIFKYSTFWSPVDLITASLGGCGSVKDSLIDSLGECKIQPIW